MNREKSKKKLALQLAFLIFLIIGTIIIVRQQRTMPYQHNTGFIFGTVYNITYQSDKNLQKEIEAELQKVDASLSPFNKSSIISKVNRNEKVEVNSMFTDVFNLAQKISEETGGAFDITVAPLVNAWGFGFKNDSFGSLSPYIQWVVTIFMILFGVNFNTYFLLLLRRFRRAAASEEVRGYFLIILVAIGIITLNIHGMYDSLGVALRHAAFQVGSIITTTGFSSCDFDLWPTLSKEVLVMLMFVGACAGSTGGGIKVSRLLILGKTLGKELKQALHPQVVAPARMDGKLINHETIRATNVFLAAYIFIFAASLFFISLDGFDMVTNFTAIAATLNNIGPGLNQVGPMMNFGGFSNPAKLVMIFDMLAGRLEIFPMLVLFLPDTWRKF